jgi:excisionase family DNA binding protein
VGLSPYLTTDEVAARLHCSRRSIHELTRTGAIPHRRPPGARRCLFLEAELVAWLDGAALVARDLPRGGRVVKPA